MTTDERIADITAHLSRCRQSQHVDDVRFLLAELDAARAERDNAIDENIRLMNAETEALRAQLAAARAREAKLRAALEQLVEPMSSRTVDTGIVRQKMLVVSGDDAMERYEMARAALAEGEDTK